MTWQLFQINFSLMYIHVERWWYIRVYLFASLSAF